MNKDILNLLYRSFDVKLTEEEKHKLEQALQNSDELRREKAQLIAMRKSISESSPKSFSHSFSDQIIHRLEELRESKNDYEIFFDTLFTIFRPVAVATILLMITLVSIKFIKNDEVSLKNTIELSEIYLDEVFDPLVDIVKE